MSRQKLSLNTLTQNEARRIALAAQGLDRPRPLGRVDVRHLRGVVRRLGLLQLDYVKVLAPSHYLVPFSRLGPYDRLRLDDLVYGRRELIEQWAHEASVVPVEIFPLLRASFDDNDRRLRALARFMGERAPFAERVLGEVRARGPLAADDLEEPAGSPPRGTGGSWGWTLPKVALEALFVHGRLAVVERRKDLARVFDLAERLIPARHHGREIDREEALRELLRRSARAHGVGTAADLADYFRMPVGVARPRLAELVASGDLSEVRVEGWREPAYLHPEARRPRRVEASALLSPFDPVVWFRPRAARLFDFEYRFEIFIPKTKRRWGAYVLPFLLGDRLVARVDLKSDRPKSRLRVLGAYLEPGARTDPGEEAVSEALAAEIGTLAAWLGLGAVTVGRRGDFARSLAAALRG